jgi:hypothetical protein
MDTRYARILIALLLAALFSGCATTQVNAPSQPAATLGTTMASAAQLARDQDAQAGAAREQITREIERLLASVDDATLAREAAMLPAGDPLYVHAGRALLARGLPLPRPFERGEQWRFDLNGRPAAERDGYRPPVKLAVLLPLSGPLAAASAPVRDGFLAGYYGETRRRPEIDFFDTAGTASGALAAYSRAAAAGVDFVVGPLGRDEVGALFASPTLDVPVLALNRGNVAPPPGNAAFSLAPEEDGVIAAEYLLARERRSALVISGSDDNGRRAAAAFRERFIERGGSVVDTLSVGEAPGDLSANLSAAAQKGVDSVFLAVRGSTARVLTPQLALAGLGAKSRVGTSQLTQGTGKPEEDTALDGISFPTEAWTARGIAGLPAASVAAAQLPTARGGAARLFAFGHDAWRLSAYLERLATGDNAQLEGATGLLRLDGLGNVLRTPAWSTFSGGRPVPIASGG